jgi:hypothetical protein
MDTVVFALSSEHRDKVKYPNSGSFTYILPSPVNDVVSFRLSSIELPNLFYTFSESLQNTSFYLLYNFTTYGESYQELLNTGIDELLSSLHTDATNDEYQYMKLTIPDGNYTSAQLLNVLQTLLTNAQIELNGVGGFSTGAFDFTVSLDDNNRRLTITNAGEEDFGLHFINRFGLGYHMGFRDLYYLPDEYDTSEVKAFTGTAILDTIGEQFVYMKVNDYGCITATFSDPNVDGTNNSGNQIFPYDNRLLAKIVLNKNKETVIYDNGANFITKSYNFRQPVKISRLDIRLYDSKKRIIDMNSMEYSMTFEITTVINSNLKATIDNIPYSLNNHVASNTTHPTTHPSRPVPQLTQQQLQTPFQQLMHESNNTGYASYRTPINNEMYNPINNNFSNFSFGLPPNRPTGHL